RVAGLPSPWTRRKPETASDPAVASTQLEGTYERQCRESRTARCPPGASNPWRCRPWEASSPLAVRLPSFRIGPAGRRPSHKNAGERRLGKSPCMEPSQAATQRGPMLGAQPRGQRYVHAGSAPRRCLNVRPTEVRMRIIINGAGIAGPTLAYWLRKAGHEVVLVEAAPQLRTGGYVIDFGLVGYDIAEKMGLIPRLRELGYQVRELCFVDREGRTSASMSVDVLARLTHG